GGGGGGNYITNYTYDFYGNLTTVSMPRPTGTQTRTFVWSGKQLVSATNPENGRTSYGYDAATKKIAGRTDAKGQRVAYSYDGYGSRATSLPLRCRTTRR